MTCLLGQELELCRYVGGKDYGLSVGTTREIWLIARVIYRWVPWRL